MRDLEAGNRDQADGTGRLGWAEPLGNPQTRRPIASGGEGLRDDQFAIERAAGMGEVDKIFAAIATIDRDDATAVMGPVIDADDAS
jgi:hypothetical protein